MEEREQNYRLFYIVTFQTSSIKRTGGNEQETYNHDVSILMNGCVIMLSPTNYKMIQTLHNLINGITFQT
jgi:hypothetical protein